MRPSVRPPPVPAPYTHSSIPTPLPSPLPLSAPPPARPPSLAPSLTSPVPPPARPVRPSRRLRLPPSLCVSFTRSPGPAQAVAELLPALRGTLVRQLEGNLRQWRLVEAQARTAPCRDPP